MITAEELAKELGRIDSEDLPITHKRQLAEALLPFIQSRAAGMRGAGTLAIMEVSHRDKNDKWSEFEPCDYGLAVKRSGDSDFKFRTQPPKDAGAVPPTREDIDAPYFNRMREADQAAAAREAAAGTIPGDLYAWLAERELLPEPEEGGHIAAGEVVDALNRHEAELIAANKREAAARAQVVPCFVCADDGGACPNCKRDNPTPQALTACGDGGEAAGYVTTDGKVTWYTENFGTISRKPKPGTDVYTRPSPSPVADADVKSLASKVGVFYHDGTVRYGAPLYAFTPDELLTFARRLKDAAHD